MYRKGQNVDRVILTCQLSARDTRWAVLLMTPTVLLITPTCETHMSSESDFVLLRRSTCLHIPVHFGNSKCVYGGLRSLHATKKTCRRFRCSNVYFCQVRF